MTTCQKISYLTNRVGALLKSDIKFTVLLLAKVITQQIGVLFSVYILLWIASFKQSGVIETQAETKSIYQKIILYSLVSLVVTAPLIGWIADKISRRVFIVVSFLFRGLACLSFTQIDDPRNPLPVIITVMMMQFSMWEYIGIESTYMKALPSDVRGMMVGLFQLMGQIGTVLFTFTGGYLFDKYSPVAPFVLLGSLDLTFLLAFLCLIMCGRMQD